jgi:RNA polymerase sigma-70 factor (ECF subfamily)
MAACMTGSVDAAHDLAQEAFVRLLDCPVRHRQGNFKAFLTTTAYHLALKEIRRTSRSPRMEGGEIESHGPSPLEESIHNETERAIIRAVQSLPEEQRDVFALRFIAGHSYEEIAGITGIPVGTVKSRLFYAVRSCRDKLKRQGVFT